MMKQWMIKAAAWWSSLKAENDGQALVEYALVVALIALAAIGALSYFGHSTANSLNNIANSVSSNVNSATASS
ncbi:MAG: Flp family type IVb pilin [Firmicutes bacterium]|nr:Flp family type IVb pilin [Bacillota bacterium]